MKEIKQLFSQSEIAKINRKNKMSFKTLPEEKYENSLFDFKTDKPEDEFHFFPNNNLDVINYSEKFDKNSNCVKEDYSVEGKTVTPLPNGKKIEEEKFYASKTPDSQSIGNDKTETEIHTNEEGMTTAKNYSNIETTIKENEKLLNLKDGKTLEVKRKDGTQSNKMHEKELEVTNSDEYQNISYREEHSKTEKTKDKTDFISDKFNLKIRKNRDESDTLIPNQREDVTFSANFENQKKETKNSGYYRKITKNLNLGYERKIESEKASFDYARTDIRGNEKGMEENPELKEKQNIFKMGAVVENSITNRSIEGYMEFDNTQKFKKGEIKENKDRIEGSVQNGIEGKLWNAKYTRTDKKTQEDKSFKEYVTSIGLESKTTDFGNDYFKIEGEYSKTKGDKYGNSHTHRYAGELKTGKEESYAKISIGDYDTKIEDGENKKIVTEQGKDFAFNIQTQGATSLAGINYEKYKEIITTDKKADTIRKEAKRFTASIEGNNKGYMNFNMKYKTSNDIKEIERELQLSTNGKDKKAMAWWRINI